MWQHEIEVNGHLYVVTLGPVRGDPIEVVCEERRTKGKPRLLAYWHRNSPGRISAPQGDNAIAIEQAQEIFRQERQRPAR